MNINHFSYFIAIADECSLTRAAEKLYLSQSTLSRFLAGLENSLGTSLFIRNTNNSLAITEAGLLYYSFCKKVVSEYDKTIEQIQKSSNQSSSRIRCGVTSERGIADIASFLPRFTRMHPTVTVDLVLKPVAELMEMLHDRELDFARCAYWKMDPHLSYIPLMHRRMDIIVPPNHKFASKGTYGPSDAMPSIRIEQLKYEPMVLLTSNTVQRKALDEYFVNNNFVPKIYAEVSTSLSAIALVESGLAISIIPRISDSKKAKYFQLEPPLYIDSGLIYRKKTFLDKAKKDLIKLFKEYYL